MSRRIRLSGMSFRPRPRSCVSSKRRRVLLVFEERNGNAAGRREARMTGTWVRPKEPRVWCQPAGENLGRTLHRKTFFDLPSKFGDMSWRSDASFEIFKSRLAKQVYKSDIFLCRNIKEIYVNNLHIVFIYEF